MTKHRTASRAADRLVLPSLAMAIVVFTGCDGCDLLPTPAEPSLRSTPTTESSSRGEANPPVKPGELAEVAARIGVAFPDSFRAIGIECHPGLDDSIQLKLEMSGADWDAFRDRLGLAADDFEDAQRIFLPPSDDWWDPGLYDPLPTAQQSREQGCVLNIGYHQAAPDRVTVFIFWHET